MKKFLIIFLLASLSLVTAIAQPGKGKVSVSKNLAMANELLIQHSYYNAVDYLLNVIELEPDNIPVMYQLADTYYKARDYKNAEFYFGKVLTYNDAATALNYPLIQFKFAQAYKNNKKYAQAKDQFEQFIDTYDGNRSNFYKNWSRAEITGCTMAQNMKSDEKTKAILLGKNINSGYTDYAPLPLGDTTLIFSSIRSKFYLDNSSNLRRSEILFSERGADRKWKKPVLLKAPQRLSTYHTGHGSYSPNGDRFYFTRCPIDEIPNSTCAIYVTEYKNDYWSIPLQLKEMNLVGYKSSSPSVAENGYGKERVYFSSNRPGGRGGADIWYVDRDAEGTYSEAVNLGNKVNTSNNDITPYFDKRLSTLFFSSNGYPGIGGFDVFKTKKSGGSWGTVENLESPVNSSVDDMYFIMVKNKDYGYFVSNRNSQFGVDSETCCDKIYAVDFDYKEPLPAKSNDPLTQKGINVEGIVFGASDETIVELEGVQIQLFENVSSKESYLVAEVYSPAAEPYFLPLEPGKKYSLRFSYPGYSTEYIDVDTKGMSGAKTMRKDLYLIKDKPKTQAPPKEEPVIIPPKKEEVPVVKPPKKKDVPVVKPPKKEAVIPKPKKTVVVPEPIIDPAPPIVDPAPPVIEESGVLMEVNGMVYSNNGNDLDPLAGALVTVYKYNPTSNKRKVYSEVYSTSKGYSIALKEKGTYILNFKEKGHLTTSFSVSTFAPDGTVGGKRDVALKVKKEGSVFTIDKIYYEKNSFELKSESKSGLKKLAKLLMENPTVIIEIGSHTDSSGEDSYNLNLSKKRAKSVVDYLVTSGTNQAQLKYKGYGESYPVAPNDSEQNMQLNRRTEFKVIGSITEE